MKKRMMVGLLASVLAVSAWAQDALTFAKGADISWITQIEASGKYELVDESGRKTDGFQMLRDCGMNMVRLRVWVNPKPDRQSGRTWCDTPDLVTKAVRAQEAGMRVMVDFHYSTCKKQESSLRGFRWATRRRRVS